jgi:hypothetical protein
MIIAMPKGSPMSYLALGETAHGQMMIAMPKISPMRDCPRPDDDSHAKEEPSEQTPVSTHS